MSDHRPDTPVLVTGGTGTLGRQVVERLRGAGRRVRVLSRSPQAAQGGVEFALGDLATGEGIPTAVAGVPAVVHCASARSGDARATGNLVTALATHTPAAHLVYVSIVGVDRVGWGYFREKLRAEQVIADSRLPWTMLRTTQFFDLIRSGAARLCRLPVVPVPARFVVRPIDSADVAARLADFALGAPTGRAPDLGGPEVSDFATLIRTYVRMTGRRRVVAALPLPGLGAVRAGALLPDPDCDVATGRTWEEYLATRI